MKGAELDATLLKWRGYLGALGLPFVIYQSMCLGLIRNGEFFDERVVELAVLWDDVKDKLDALMAPPHQYTHTNAHAADGGLMYFKDAEIQVVCFKNGKAVYNPLDSTCLVFSEELLKRENWTKYRYLDLDWNLPGNPEQYLTEAYGDWRTPHPGYRWYTDANNLVSWGEI